jgi:hypothetical protein
MDLAHYHPGRLRLRASAFRDDHAAECAREALLAEPGITAVAHNASTGSLRIDYEPGLADPERILFRVASAAALDLPLDEREARFRRTRPALIAIDAMREINTAVEELTGARADLRTLVPVGLAALATYSLAFGHGPRLPRWDSLLYWAYSTFTQMHRREIEGEATAPAPSRFRSHARPE